MENREVYQGKMESQLSEWGADIDKLKAKADKATADTKQGYYNQIESLHAKQVSMETKLLELKTSSDDAWEDLKDGLEHTWKQVKDSFNMAAARFK